MQKTTQNTETAQAKSQPPLPHHQLLAVAVEAKADPRTVRRFLLGCRVQPLVQERIERALRVLNLISAGQVAR